MVLVSLVGGLLLQLLGSLGVLIGFDGGFRVALRRGRESRLGPGGGGEVSLMLQRQRAKSVGKGE